MPYPNGGGTPADYAIVLATPAFYLILAVLGLFLAMYIALRRNTRSKRALEGLIEATQVDFIFLVLSVALLVVLFFYYPRGNHTAYALSQVVLNGYWLTFAIPVVTVGSSVHSKTRGQVSWLAPSILVAAGLFLLIFWWTFVNT